MSRWISQNISLFFISLLLAFFFWAAATEAEDPTRTDTYLSQIPVEVTGLQESMVAYGGNNSRVRVELKAPESVWSALGSDDISAYVDVSDVGTGTLNLPVNVELSQHPALVTVINPREIELTIEYFIRYNRHAGWNENNTNYPFYKESKDSDFVEACESILNDKLMSLQWYLRL